LKEKSDPYKSFKKKERGLVAPKEGRKGTQERDRSEDQGNIGEKKQPAEFFTRERV